MSDSNDVTPADLLRQVPDFFERVRNIERHVGLRPTGQRLPIADENTDVQVPGGEQYVRWGRFDGERLVSVTTHEPIELDEGEEARQVTVIDGIEVSVHGAVGKR